MRFGFLQEREVLLLVSRRGVVENGDLGRVPVTPEMLVVLLNRFANGSLGSRMINRLRLA